MTRRIVLSMLMLQAALPHGQPAGRASIEGSVVRAGTNEPIEDAIVILARSGEPSRSRSVRSDRQGRFVFKDLEAGAYRLAFEKDGYPPQEYGQRVWIFRGSGTPVELTGDRQVRNLVARLTPAGRVSGHVLDEDGQPVAGLPVQLLRAEYDREGGRGFTVFGSARTDDRGEYRLYFVTPGRYYLKAGFVQESRFMRNPNALPAYYTPMLYPGVADVSLATMLDVRPGADLNDVDMTLRLERLHRIRGRVIDASTGQPPAKVELTLTYHGLIGEGVRDDRTIENGIFEFRNLAPGSYALSAVVRAELPSVPRVPGTDGPTRGFLSSGVTRVDLAGADVDDLVLLLSRGASISGRVRLDNGRLPMAPFGGCSNNSGLPRFPVAGLTAGVQEGQAAPFESAKSDSVHRDGTFRITGVLPGDYDLRMWCLLPPYYVKEARFGSADVLGQPLHVTGNESTMLEVVVGSGLGSLSGLVRSRQKPAAGVQVMLVPDRVRRGADSFRQVLTDRDGRFTMPDIIPGDYKVFASEAIEGRAWFDPEVLAHESNVRTVHIAESSAQHVQLTVIEAQ